MHFIYILMEKSFWTLHTRPFFCHFAHSLQRSDRSNPNLEGEFCRLESYTFTLTLLNPFLPSYFLQAQRSLCTPVPFCTLLFNVIDSTVWEVGLFRGFRILFASFSLSSLIHLCSYSGRWYYSTRVHLSGRSSRSVVVYDCYAHSLIELMLRQLT